MKRIKVTRIRPNKLFETWLEEWRDDAASRNSELQDHFSNALAALRKYPLPLPSGKDCILLQHFGTKLCAMIDKRLEQQELISSPGKLDGHGGSQRRDQELEMKNGSQQQVAVLNDILEVSDDDDDDVDEPCCSKNTRVAPLDDDDGWTPEPDYSQDLGLFQVDDADDNDDDDDWRSNSPSGELEERQLPVRLARESSFSLMPGSFDVILLVDTQEVKG